VRLRSTPSIVLACALAAGCVPPPTSTRPTPVRLTVTEQDAIALDGVAIDRFRDDYDLSVVPPRPHLDGDAPDTNDAQAYYEHGARLLWTRPGEAAESFAWATRLDPTFGQAYYDRWLALDRQRGSWLRGHGAAGIDLTPAAAARLDSLRSTAFALNPFLVTAEDRAGPRTYAWADDRELGREAFRRADYAAAIERLGRVLAKDPHAGDVRVDRARAMFFLHRYDDAAQELTLALASAERAENDSGRLAPGLTKELFDYAIGILQAQRGDLTGAREAYERAVADNLGFAMAHARLAGVALLQHDTTTALVEYQTAIAIRSDDAGVRCLYGYALFRAGRLDDAEHELREAVRLDPDYALPYVWIGRALDARHTAGAADAYALFLAHAARDDAERPAVLGRLATGPTDEDAARPGVAPRPR
jgi:tetratricopeptide (TPR) repeat protein